MPTDNIQGVRNALAEYLLGTVLPTASENRKAIELKWNRNRAIRYADPLLDPKGTWKKNERRGKWKSGTFFAYGRQKIVTAHAITNDALFKDGKVPIQVVVQDEGSSTEEIQEDPAASVYADNQVEWEQARLHRQLRSCHALREFSMALDDDLTYGECWGHVYATSEIESLLKPIAYGVMAPDETEHAMMGFERVSPWEMFYDLESGRDPESWSYCMRQQQRSPSDVARMDDGSGLFNPLAIKRVLDAKATTHGEPNSTSGSGDTSIAPRVRNLPKLLKTLWTREWFVDVPVEKLTRFEAQWAAELATGADSSAQPTSDGAGNLAEKREWDVERVWALTVENEVVAYQRNPTGHTYYRAECEPNNDQASGIGIADKMEFVTQVLNGMIRSYENNSKLLSGLVAAVKREMMDNNPEDAIGEDGGIIELSENCDDARKAIQQVTFENILAPLVEGIRMFLEFGDYESQIPRAEQGAQAANPQTAFELQQRLERSGKYLGGVVQRFDELIEWAVSQMSLFNQTNPDEQAGVGNFKIIATGFTSFQNQVVRLNKLIQTLGMIVASPDLTRMHKLEWLLREIYKAQDIDPDQLLKNPDELAQDDEAQQQSEQNQLAIALMKAQVAVAEARARKDEASAAEIEASIAIAQERVGLDRAKMQTDRAQAVVDIEDKLIARTQPDETTGAGVGAKSKTKAKAKTKTKPSAKSAPARTGAKKA